MTTQAMIGHGSAFSIQNNNSPPTYDLIAEILGIKPPKLSQDAVDATHNQSPDKFREFIPGLRDGGEMSVGFNFVPASASKTKLLAAFMAGVIACKIAYPDSPSTEWLFNAICTGLEFDDPLDDKLTGTATFKITGKPAYIS